MPMTSLAALFCMLVAAGCLPVALGDSARVTLRAKWEATPLLHEAAEFLAEEDPMLFWRLAERWAPPPGGDDAQCWEAVRDAAEAELSPAMRRVFAVSMALRQYSPKLQMLRQLAAESQPASGACCWAVVGGRVVTEAAAAAAAAAAATPPTTAESEAADAAHVFPFDHVYRGKDAAQQEVNISDPGVAHAVLYAPLGAACAAPLHAALAGAADAAPGRLAYAWRPFLGGGCEAAAGPCGALGAGGPLVLPGYGVELAIKNMEYSAKDEPKKESKGEEGDEHKEQQEKQAANQEPLAPEAVARLGLLAASAVGAAPDPLAALQALAQDFPGAARDLAANGSVDPYLPDSLASLQTYLPPGAHFLLLNGLIYDLHDFNLYELLAAVRKEVRLHDMLHGAGLPPRQARGAALLRGSAAGDGEGAPRLALNSDEFIAWVNDLENDRQYAGWPTSLQMLLMPMFPGRLPQVGRNILTAIYAFDPASPAALDIGQLVAQMRAQNWPIRFGLLPVVPELAARTKTAAAAASPAGGDGDEAREASASERMGRLLALVAHAYGGDTAARFLGDLRAQMEPAGDDSKQFQFLLANAAQRVFFARWQQWAAEAGTAKARATARVPAHTAFKNAMEGTASGSEVLSFLKGAAELARSTGLAGKAKAGVLVFNGAILANDVGSWRAATMQGLQAAMRAVQEDVYHQRLSDDAEDVYEEFLALHGAVPRINSKILSLEGRGPRYMRVSGEIEEYEALQLALAGPELGRPALAGLALRPLGAAPAAGAGAPPVTHLVVADPTTHLGLSLLAGALAHSSAKGRVELVLNPASDPGALSPVEQLLLAAATGGAGASEDLRQLVASVADLRQLVEKLLQLPPAELAGTTAVQLEGWLPGGGLVPALGEAAPTLAELAARHARFVRAGLRLGPRAAAVVSNGRVVEVEESDEIAPEDFALMELCAERNQYTQVSELVDSAVEAGAVDADTAADVAMAASSVLAALAPEEADPRSGHVSDTLLKWREQVNSIEVVPRAGEPAEAPLFIQAVLNPLSKAAQRLAPLLAFLRQAFDPEMQVTLNPVTKLAQLPLKTYYRYALPDLAPGPPRPATASFAGLPHDRTLTLGMDVPEPWLVEPVEAEHDLDNLVMGELAPGEAMTAEYELEALLLTGMCLDLASLQARIQSQIHPRGVQLQLGTAAQPAGVDTLVMSNLGYFQLKAAPGVWHLQLAPGRSQQLFTVASSTGATAGDAAGAVSATPGALGVPVALTSFSGKHMYLFLRKHADRLEEDVLQPADEGAGSVWGKLGTWASGRADVPAGVESGEDERIHVFTVASGHMYERLQKIMILSAIKRTRARMKFWFIKNYMSPQMKAFVPYMARKYGFDYEFVTYKWPSWLHKQTEKQRIIWAYKILFLDVLFPLGLKKVIFCDSDQVVRADLRELWEMDLQGAPYGYTPFCNNNRDMDGFRFWKQGFWAEHLQGRPYHISALYVIDLERFRQMAAGDRLRVMYDGLSKDPNSLANLDQDLPNYAQSTVPIFSLPQEWLWCETWCGAETRPQAKTIDLCNNPLTKEPKLQSARRIIAEWPDLNREAEEFTALVGRVQAGHMTEEALLADTSAFRTYLEPMVEGSVRTTGGLPACGLEGACGADGDDDGQQQPAVTDVGEAAPHEEL